MAELVENTQGTHYDELIGSTAMTPLTKNVNVTFAAAGTMVRGTLIAEGIDSTSSKPNGKYVACAKGAVAVAVLAADVIADKAGDVVGTVYTTGIFNRENLVAAADDTVAAHEEELRKIGIHMTSVKV